MPDKQAENFVIKAAGLTEYLAGSHLLSSFEFVRKYVQRHHPSCLPSDRTSLPNLCVKRCIAKNEKIEFVIVENESSPSVALDELDIESLEAFTEMFEKGNEVSISLSLSLAFVYCRRGIHSFIHLTMVIVSSSRRPLCYTIIAKYAHPSFRGSSARIYRSGR